MRKLQRSTHLCYVWHQHIQMIVCEIITLLICQLTKNFERAQVIREFTSGYDWIKNVDRSIDRQNGRHFSYNHVDFPLNLKGDSVSQQKLKAHQIVAYFFSCFV